MILPDLTPFFGWLQAHPYLATLITYFISLLECFVVIGFFIPGSVLMTAIGSLIGMGILPATSIMVWAIMGAITGDLISFWLGRHYYQRANEFWLFGRYPNILKKGQLFFYKHGGKSIFVGRFIGPIRAILPFIAGMVFMPTRQFLIADVISAIAWAPIYMLPGILLGQASQRLPPEVATQLVIFVVLLLLFIWLSYSFIKSCYAGFSRLLNNLVAYLWQFTRNHPRLTRITILLTDSRQPQSHTQLALALICIFSLFLFLVILLNVKTHGIITSLNEPIYYFMRSFRQETLDKIFVGVTELSPRVISIFWLLLFVLLLKKQNFRLAFYWLLVGSLSYGLGDFFKYMVHLPRPTGLLQTPSGSSFPSGHTLSSISILGFFSVLLSLGRPKQIRLLTYGVTGGIIFLIAISRLYLTAHWFTDVLAGIFLGVSIVSGATLFYRRTIAESPILSTKIANIGIVFLLICWGSNLYYDYKRLLFNSQLLYPKQIISAKKWWDKGQLEPIYRMGRFGQKVEIFNIQWVDKLSNIQSNLEKQAWRILPKSKVLSTLYKLSTHNYNPNIPILNLVNYGQKPVLTMIKYFESNHSLLVLNLWDSHKKLSNHLTLWVGLIYYYKIWHLQFQLIKHQQPKHPLPPPDKLLTKDLKSYIVKTIYYPHSLSAVLFIKPH